MIVVHQLYYFYLIGEYNLLNITGILNKSTALNKLYSPIDDSDIRRACPIGQPMIVIPQDLR